MKALKLVIDIMLVATTVCGTIDFALAESRTLTTMLVITVKAPDTRQAPMPAAAQEIYNTALAQSQASRFIKVEGPIDSPMGLPRYTMSEKL